jgi:DNA (cytosine-5)-methyltransferase 1
LSPNGVDSFHTPNTTGLDGGSNSRRALKKRLLPTPDASPRGPTKDYNPQAKSQSGRTLQSFAAKFPTPQASDHRDRGNMSNPSIQRRVAIGKQIMLSQSVHPTSGNLNPPFPEWLMGWPLGWTDLKPLEMDKSHYVQQQHGES